MAEQNYIGGEWRSGAQTLDNIGPATGSVIGTIPRSDAGQVDAAVQAAKRAGKYIHPLAKLSKLSEVPCRIPTTNMDFFK